MTGKFFKVKCTKCANEQNIYEKATTNVKCLVCGAVLAESTGGKVKLAKTAKILKELD